MTISRRNFLRGLGGGLISLPMLPLLEARAQQGEFPKRLFLMYTPNGTILDRWRPTGGETDWDIPTGDILEPLLRHRDDLLILDGIDMASERNDQAFGGHGSGMAHLWTGTEMAGGGMLAGGISVDQHVANALHDDEPYRTLTLGVGVGRGGGDLGSVGSLTRMSHLGAESPANPQTNPQQLFDQAFSDLGRTADEIARIRARRASVLDGTSASFERLKTRISSKDVARVEAHLSSVRALEQQLDSGLIGAACDTPTLHGNGYAAEGKSFLDMIVMAFACNLTRVTTLQWSDELAQVSYPWLNIGDVHHEIGHDTSSSGKEKLVTVQRWYAEQFAYLIDQMKAIPEGNGTMFDNTLMVWGSAMSDGATHTNDDIPFVLAGSCGGYLRTGRYLKLDQTAHNDLLVSICNAMGLDDQTFGNPQYCTGPISALT